MLSSSVLTPVSNANYPTSALSSSRRWDFIKLNGSSLRNIWKRHGHSDKTCLLHTHAKRHSSKRLKMFIDSSLKQCCCSPSDSANKWK